MIPVTDLSRQIKSIEKELKREILKTVDSGYFILGKKVEEFEKAFAGYIGVKHAIGAASGTDAISLALLSLGIGQGDGVIMPANSYPSVFAVTQIGAIPQLVDIDPATFNMNPELISKAINKKTRAIMPVHLYGQPADMGRILEIGKRFNLPIVEDCAQGHGAEVNSGTFSPRLPKLPRSLRERETEWIKVGGIGSLACFSFYPTKNLGCLGDGGMVVTNDDKLAGKVRLLRMYGEDSRYHSVILGRNSRLDEIQAAILLVKLKYLDKWNERRREIANIYKSKIQKITSLRGAERRSNPMIQQNDIILGRKRIASPAGLLVRNDISPPEEASYVHHIYHLFVIRSKKRDKLKDYLEKKGIRTAIHYPVPIHLAPSMKYLGYKKGDFPESERACEEVLSLPMFPEMTNMEINQIVNAIHKFHY